MEYKTLIGVLTVSLLLAVPAVVAMEPEPEDESKGLTYSTFDPLNDLELINRMMAALAPNPSAEDILQGEKAREELKRRASLRKNFPQMGQLSEQLGKDWSFWDYLDFRKWSWFPTSKKFDPIFEDPGSHF